MKYYRVSFRYSNIGSDSFICDEEQFPVIESAGYIIDKKEEVSEQDYNKSKGTELDYANFLSSYGSLPFVTEKLQELSMDIKKDTEELYRFMCSLKGSNLSDETINNIRWLNELYKIRKKQIKEQEAKKV